MNQLLLNVITQIEANIFDKTLDKADYVFKHWRKIVAMNT